MEDIRNDVSSFLSKKVLESNKILKTKQQMVNFNNKIVTAGYYFRRAKKLIDETKTRIN